MRLFVLLSGLLVAIAAVAAPSGAAEHIGQMLNGGEAGTFTIASASESGFSAYVPAGETNVSFLAGTTSVLIIKESYADGVLRFSNPGLQANNRPTVTGTFTGPSSGRTYTVIGILA